jgi:hypothetical protein
MLLHIESSCIDPQEAHRRLTRQDCVQLTGIKDGLLDWERQLSGDETVSRRWLTKTASTCTSSSAPRIQYCWLASLGHRSGRTRIDTRHFGLWRCSEKVKVNQTSFEKISVLIVSALSARSGTRTMLVVWFLSRWSDVKLVCPTGINLLHPILRCRRSKSSSRSDGQIRSLSP